MPTGQDARKLAHRAGATATTDRKVNKKTQTPATYHWEKGAPHGKKRLGDQAGCNRKKHDKPKTARQAKPDGAAKRTVPGCNTACFARQNGLFRNTVQPPLQPTENQRIAQSMS